MAANRNIALNMLRETGGRQAIESHLKAQKAAWKFSGQKEAFYECMCVHSASYLGGGTRLVCVHGIVATTTSSWLHTYRLASKLNVHGLA